MTDEISRPGLPASLADIDPFAAPANPAHPSRPLSAVPGSSGTNAAGRSAASAEAGETVPCPCACACGNATDMTFAELESFAAARFLRCGACAKALHFGPQWAAADPAAARSHTSPDREVVGDKSGVRFTVREPVVDPEDEALKRQAAIDLATQHRDAARQRWLDGLPERWKLPYDDGESLVPEVEERLARFRSGAAGDHGTSLLCIGPFGSGKTWVAYTYARAAVDRRLLWPQEIRVGTEGEIMEPLALASPWELTAATNALLKPTLKMLIIDDVGALGTYKNHENRHATWSKVVNWAYEHKRALVLTTNKTLGLVANEPDTKKHADLLENWIGPTAYERLKHMVGAHQVFRDENKRAELTARWESEYQTMLAGRPRD